MSDKALSFDDFVLDDYDFNLYSDEDLVYLWEWVEMDDFSDLQQGGGGKGPVNTYMMDAPEDNQMKSPQPPPSAPQAGGEGGSAPPPSMPQGLMPQAGGAAPPPSMPKGLMPQGGGAMPSMSDMDDGFDSGGDGSVPDISDFGIDLPNMPSKGNAPQGGMPQAQAPMSSPQQSQGAAAEMDDFDFDFGGDDDIVPQGDANHQAPMQMPEMDDFDFNFDDDASPPPSNMGGQASNIPTPPPNMHPHSAAASIPTPPPNMAGGHDMSRPTPPPQAMGGMPSSQPAPMTQQGFSSPPQQDYLEQHHQGGGSGGEQQDDDDDFDFNFDDTDFSEENFDDGEQQNQGQEEGSNSDNFDDDDDFNFDFGADDGGEFQDFESDSELDFSEEAQEQNRQSAPAEDDFDFNFEDDNADGIGGTGGYSAQDDEGGAVNNYGDADTDEFGNPRYIETSAGTLDILTHNLLDFLQQLEFDEFLQVLQDNPYVYDRIMADDQWSDEEMDFLRSIEPLVKDSNKIQEVRGQQSFNPIEPVSTGYEDKDMAMQDTRIHKTLAGLYEHIKERSLALMENNPVKISHLPKDLAKLWIQDTQEKQSKRIGKMMGTQISKKPHPTQIPADNLSPHSFVSKTQIYYEELTMILSSELMAMNSQLEEDAMSFIKADASRFGEQFTNFLLDKYGTKILFLYLSQMKSDVLADKMFDNVMEYIRKYIAPPMPEDFTQDFFRSILRIIQKNNLKI